MKNTFGSSVSVTLFGESHGTAVGAVLDGMAPGVPVDEGFIARQLELRRPFGTISTARREPDAFEIVSGVFEGKTTGTPLCILIRNTDVNSAAYDRDLARPGHADYTARAKYHGFADYRGGGHFSGRVTAALVAVGAIALTALRDRGIAVGTHIARCGGIADRAFADLGADLAALAEKCFAVLDDAQGEKMRAAIEAAAAEGDSVGGVLETVVTGLPAGVGEPWFDTLEGQLAHMLFSIPAVKGVEFGDGFAATHLTGSEYNDAFTVVDGEVRTATNRQGGVLGGRTSGMPIVFRVALRPTPTIFRPQPSVDLATLQPAVCAMKGRHDPCIVRRAVPVVEAVASFVIADLLVGNAANLPRICLTLTGATLAEDVAQFRSQRYFTDIVELRVDKLTAAERARAAEFPQMVPVPVILTFRRTVDGGDFDGAEAERIAFFKAALSSRGFAYVDFEDDFRHAELTALAHAAGVRIIRSLHDFTGPVPDILARCRALRGETDEIPKIAFQPHRAADVERLFAETAGDRSFPRILCAMGELGLPSRVQAARTGSLLTYASVGGLGKIGHVTPYDLVRKYNIRQA